MVRTMRSSSLLMRRCTSSRRRSNTSSSFRSPQVGQCLNRRNLSSTSPNNGSPAAVRANVLCGMSETLSKKSLLSGGWKRAQRRPPSFSLSAWTFDSGRRTFINMQTSEQGLSKGPKISVTGRPSKKRPRFSVSGTDQDDLLNDPCFVPRRFGLNRREGLLDPLNAQGDAALSTSA